MRSCSVMIFFLLMVAMVDFRASSMKILAAPGAIPRALASRLRVLRSWSSSRG